jgi:hypothetical protein
LRALRRRRCEERRNEANFRRTVTLDLSSLRILKFGTAVIVSPPTQVPEFKTVDR